MSTANDTIISVGVKLEAYVDDLSPGKTYNLRVLGFSNGGDGRMSSPTITFQMGDYHTASAYRNSALGMRFNCLNVFTLLSCLYFAAKICLL